MFPYPCIRSANNLTGISSAADSSHRSTKYEIMLQAYNSKGAGSSSEIITAVTFHEGEIAALSCLCVQSFKRVLHLFPEISIITMRLYDSTRSCCRRTTRKAQDRPPKSSLQSLFHEGEISAHSCLRVSMRICSLLHNSSTELCINMCINMCSCSFKYERSTVRAKGVHLEAESAGYENAAASRFLSRN